MAGGVTLNNGAGGNILNTDLVGGVDTQIIKIGLGAPGVAPTLVSAANPMPVVGVVTVGALQGQVLLNPASVVGIAGTVAVSGTVNSNLQDGAGNDLTSNTVGLETALCVQLVDNSGIPIVNFGSTGGTNIIDGSTFSRTVTQETPVGGVVETNNPTLLPGTAAAFSLDTAGNLRVAVDAGGAQAGTPGTPSGDVLSIQGEAGMVPVLVTLTPTSASTKTKVLSAGSTNAAVIKGAAGSVLSYALFNNSATAKFVKFFDKASTPVPGTDVPAFTLTLQPNGGANCDFSSGIPFTAGIGIAITNGVADNDASVTAANDVCGVLVTK